MPPYQSAVLEHPASAPAMSRDYMQAQLACHTDAWDVAQDIEHGAVDIVVVDARSSEAYARGHIPSAISLPHRQMTPASLATLDRSKTYVVYCDGIGCNASTKGAYKLAGAGLHVKELLGGLDYWIRESHPVMQGEEAGTMHEALAACGCAA